MKYFEKTNFKPEDFNVKNDVVFNTQFESRYMKPVKFKDLPENHLFFKNAQDIAKTVNLETNTRNFIIVSGNFIFGDLIEAIVYRFNLKVNRLLISTLSLSENNIDSLNNLFVGNFLERLDLIVSDYFYAHEKFNLIPYMLRELDKKNRFQLAIAASHTKIALLKTPDKHIVIHGSANLRSSNSIEQICIEENKPLYYFNETFHDKIIEKHKIINKAVRDKTLWQTITKK